MNESKYILSFLVFYDRLLMMNHDRILLRINNNSFWHTHMCFHYEIIKRVLKANEFNSSN